MVPMMEAFDYTNTAEPLGVRPVTTVAPQALMLLNDAFVERQAAAFSERVIAEAGGDDQAVQIQRAFELALGRKPSPREMSISMRLFRKQTEDNEPNSSDGPDETDRRALVSLCLSILNLNEFVYLD